MAEYEIVVSFGGIFFKAGNIVANEKPATLKSNIGKGFVEKRILLKDTKNKVLEINGVITGLSQTSAQSIGTAIENDRASLIALDDGIYHSYDDGKHTGNFVIVSGSLRWNDESTRESSAPYKFSMTLIEW